MQRSDTEALPTIQSQLCPIQRARLNKGYTQEELASRSAVTKIYVQHLEFGILSSAPKKILELLSPNPSHLQDAYTEWIASTRLINGSYVRERVGRFIDGEGDPCSEEFGNWLFLRKSISRSKIGFCKLLCLHPQILATFEGTLEDRTEFTPGIRGLLVDCGVDRGDIALMDMALLKRNKYASEGYKL